jgi:hypothetical protein
VKNGVWKGVAKMSHQHTHRRAVTTRLCVSVHSGRGKVGSRWDEVMMMRCLSFVLNKN